MQNAFPVLPNAPSEGPALQSPPTRGPYFPIPDPFPIRNFPVKEKLCPFRTPKQHPLTTP